MLILEQLKSAVSLLDYGIFMSRIRSGHLACGYLQHSEPHRDEHILIVVLAYLRIDLLEHLCGTAAYHRVVADEYL